MERMYPGLVDWNVVLGQSLAPRGTTERVSEEVGEEALGFAPDASAGRPGESAVEEGKAL